MSILDSNSTFRASVNTENIGTEAPTTQAGFEKEASQTGFFIYSKEIYTLWLKDSVSGQWVEHKNFSSQSLAEKNSFVWGNADAAYIQANSASSKAYVFPKTGAILVDGDTSDGIDAADTLILPGSSGDSYSVTFQGVSSGGAGPAGPAGADGADGADGAGITQWTETAAGHILPNVHATGESPYPGQDIGSAEAKVRHLFLSNNSLWVGDSHKISIDGGKMKFRKRKTNDLPVALRGLGVTDDPGLVSLARLHELAGQHNILVEDLFAEDDFDDEVAETSATNEIIFDGKGKLTVSDSGKLIFWNLNGNRRKFASEMSHFDEVAELKDPSLTFLDLLLEYTEKESLEEVGDMEWLAWIGNDYGIGKSETLYGGSLSAFPDLAMALNTWADLSLLAEAPDTTAWVGTYPWEDVYGEWSSASGSLEGTTVVTDLSDVEANAQTISEEVNRATAAEEANAQAISEEVNRATAAELDLLASIDNISFPAHFEESLSTTGDMHVSEHLYVRKGRKTADSVLVPKEWWTVSGDNATLTVDSVGWAAGDTITITNTYSNIAVTLTGVAGTRTAGSNDFSIDPASTDAQATEIAAAINDAANSAAAIVWATATTNVVRLTAASGALGTIDIVASVTTGSATTLDNDGRRDGKWIKVATSTPGYDDGGMFTEGMQTTSAVFLITTAGPVPESPYSGNVNDSAASINHIISVKQRDKDFYSTWGEDVHYGADKVYVDSLGKVGNFSPEEDIRLVRESHDANGNPLSAAEFKWHLYVRVRENKQFLYASIIGGNNFDRGFESHNWYGDIWMSHATDTGWTLQTEQNWYTDIPELDNPGCTYIVGSYMHKEFASVDSKTLTAETLTAESLTADVAFVDSLWSGPNNRIITDSSGKAQIRSLSTGVKAFPKALRDLFVDPLDHTSHVHEGKQCLLVHTIASKFDSRYYDNNSDNPFPDMESNKIHPFNKFSSMGTLFLNSEWNASLEAEALDGDEGTWSGANLEELTNLVENPNFSPGAAVMLDFARHLCEEEGLDPDEYFPDLSSLYLDGNIEEDFQKVDTEVYGGLIVAMKSEHDVTANNTNLALPKHGEGIGLESTWALPSYSGVTSVTFKCPANGLAMIQCSFYLVGAGASGGADSGHRCTFGIHDGTGYVYSANDIQLNEQRFLEEEGENMMQTIEAVISKDSTNADLVPGQSYTLQVHLGSTETNRHKVYFGHDYPPIITKILTVPTLQ